LIENRQQIGFNASVPGFELLIYHVDQDYIDAHFEDNDINATAHMGLYIKITAILMMMTVRFPAHQITQTLPIISTPSSLNWTGGATNKPMTNIVENYNMISFDFMGGHGCVPSPIQCSDLISTAVSDNSISLLWTRGMGDKVLILAKEGSTVDSDPQANMPYITNTEFGLGESPAPRIFAMYYENGNTCTVTG